MKLKYLLLVLSLWCSFSTSAQELKVTVTVSAPQLTNADQGTLETLENTISDFYNNTVFTNEEFEEHERIEVDFTVYITDDPSPNSFTADITFQSLRPVYKSNYKSPILNFVDKDVKFLYQDNQPVQNNSNSFTDDLSSMLTFYAKAILGYDYDTFSVNGGEAYFQNCQDIISRIPASVLASNPGWTKDGPNYSRYFFIENIFNPKIRNLRESFYDYHRLGLDIMNSDQDKALAIMTSAVTSIETVNRTFPNSMIVQLFADSKIDELVQVFRGGTKGQKDKVYKIMVIVDPARTAQYDQIKQF